MKRAVFLCLLIASAGVAQVTFEAAAPTCSLATYPSPCGTAGGAEGVSRNAQATGMVTVDAVANGAGFPTEGSQYGRVQAWGPDVAGGGNHMYIPIPAGATNISFQWDFYDAEGGQSGFNDGMSIDVLGACGGASLAQLVFVDDNSFVPGTGYDGGGCGNFATEQAPDGPQSVFNVALPAGAAILRVAVWNGVDNVAASHGAIDNVCFVGCVPPPPPNCILFFDSPGGPGSIRMQNTMCPALAGADYLVAITLNQGAYPNGWFYGVDIPFSELVNEYNAGFPFKGTLDAVGASTFGPIGGAPSGLTIYAVTAQFAPGFGVFLTNRTRTAYTIP